MSLVLFFLLFVYTLPCSLAASADDWRGRSIYQLVMDRYALPDDVTTVCHPEALTWCGGNWNSVRKNLDYIQRAGFTAIGISPVSQNYEGPTVTQYGDPYHGYWVADATQLNGRFGSSDDLKALSLELHNRGMYLMVDIVINDVMAISTTPDLSTYMFKNETQYHPYCVIEWGNATSEQICWLGDTVVPLADINTEDPNVVSAFQAWIRSLVQEYSIDGLLINGPHVNMNFLPDFCAAAGVFCLGEVHDLDIDKVAMYQGSKALDSVLHYPMYGALVDTFTIPGQQNMSALSEMIAQSQEKFKDCGLLGNFIENLDVARWRNLSVDPQSFDNAMVFTLMSDGIPIVYYGQEQGFNGGPDPYNREPLWSSGYANSTEYLFVSRLNKFRNFLVKSTNWLNSTMQVLTSTSDGIAFMKGPVITVLTNIGSSSKETAIPVYTPYPTETPLINILDCKQWPVGSNGTIDVSYLQGGVAVVLIPMNDIKGEGLCGDNTITSTHNTSNTSESLATQLHPLLGTRGLILTFTFAFTVNWSLLYFW